MKKIFVFTIVLLSPTLNCMAQNLTGWKHYYSQSNYVIDMGTYIISPGPEELVRTDKATLAVTRIPFPASVRNLNAHNTAYFDSTMMEWKGCFTVVSYGPENTLRTNGCLPYNYIYDGSSWTPAGTYLGFDITSLGFHKFSGGNSFFSSYYENRLYEYDGMALNYFDYTNSPYDQYNIFDVRTSANNDIFMLGSNNVAVRHSGVWTVYDSVFFNTPYVMAHVPAVSPTGDFVFYSPSDSSLHIFTNSTGLWSSVPLPPSVFHSPNHQVYSSLFDSSGNFWISGVSLFCNYDGVNFTDYFTSISGTSNNIELLCEMAGNQILINDYSNWYLFNPATSSATVFPADPQAVLSGNNIYPSLKDNSGNLWFGAYGWGMQNGVMKYDGNWSVLNLDSLGIYGSIYTIKQDTGNAIVFGYGELGSEGPVQVSGSNYTFLNPGSSYYHTVDDIAIDQNHHYWFGGHGAGIPEGLTEFDGIALFQHLNPFSPGNEEVNAVIVDSLNNKWVAYRSFDGVYKFDGTVWTQFSTGTSPLANDTVVKIILQPGTNIIWFCTAGGFVKFHNSTWEIFNSSNTPLPSDDAEFIYWDQYGTTWYGTQGGVAALEDTSWTVYTTFNSPLHNSDIESILMDDNCNIWFATEGGITSAYNSCSGTSQTFYQQVSICTGDSFVFNSHTYMADGIYYDSLQTVSLTDSIIVTVLSVNPHYHRNVLGFICEGETFTFPDGTTTTVPGSNTSSFLTSAGCDSIITTTVTFIDTTVTTAGNTLIAHAFPALYQWVDCANGYLPVTGEMYHSFTPTTTGSYAVIVSTGSCSDTSACYTITLSGRNSDAGSKTQIRIFPNPTSGKFTVVGLQSAKDKIEVFNLLGEEISQKSPGVDYGAELDLSKEPAGLYFVKIRTGQEILIRKIVKQ